MPPRALLAAVAVLAAWVFPSMAAFVEMERSPDHDHGLRAQSFSNHHSNPLGENAPLLDASFLHSARRRRKEARDALTTHSSHLQHHPRGFGHPRKRAGHRGIEPEKAWERADGVRHGQSWRREHASAAEGPGSGNRLEAEGEEDERHDIEEDGEGERESSKDEAGAGTGAAQSNVDWRSFRSVGRVRRAHVDLEAEGGMDAAIAARACEGEMIFFLAEENFFTTALNFAVNLHSVGLAHWMMLTSTEEDCDRFERALSQVLPGEPSGCVWSQLHADNIGWRHHGLQDSKYKKLQVLKMHYPGVLIERGLNALLCDVDVAFPRSFYPDVKSPPFADRELICQRDSIYKNDICNLGLVYSQNTDPAGPIHWLYAEATRRILEGLNPESNFTSRSGNRVEPGPSSILIWDQEIFGDCLISAVMGAETRIGQLHSKHCPTEEETMAMKKMSPSPTTPLKLTIPGAGATKPEQAFLTDSDDLLFLTFPDYLSHSMRPEFHEKQPMLHCNGANRGAAKKFCLSAFGFWDFRVDRVGLHPGALGGVPEKLRTDTWLRLAPGHEPNTREKWLQAVQLLFQAAVVMDRRAIIPDVPCSSTGWPFHEVIHSGGPPGSAEERCAFNQITLPEENQCGSHMDGATVPQFMWDNIMAAGPSRWRPEDSPPCGFHVVFGGGGASDNKARAIRDRDMRRKVGCVHIFLEHQSGPEERAAAGLPPPLPLTTEEQGKLDRLEVMCGLPTRKRAQEMRRRSVEGPLSRHRCIGQR